MRGRGKLGYMMKPESSNEGGVFQIYDGPSSPNEGA